MSERAIRAGIVGGTQEPFRRSGRSSAARGALLVAVLLIPACGSGGTGFGPAPVVSTPPVAIVPESFKVLVNAAGVVLNGSKSYDPVPGAPPLSYLWVQTSGTAVALSSGTAASPTFTAPAAPGGLTFMLTVTGAQGTDQASVTVSVQTFIVSAPDKWFVGYGNPVTITASVAGTTVAPVYQWTGLPAWITPTPATNTLNLSFTAPQLTDFQNFEDVPGVAVLERTAQGRAQFTITVTDGANVDSALVNYSVGPFAATVANENVAFGNPVFLNGALTVNGSAITSWTWSGTKPDGNPLSTTTDFKLPNKTALSAAAFPLQQRFVYFVPSELGTYQIQISQAPGPVVQVVTINCGKYVGVGNLTGGIPDPNAGECAACHAGQLSFLPDYANPWLQTQHSQVFAQMVDPTNPLYGPSQAKGSWKYAFDFVPPAGLMAQQLRSFEFSIDSRTLGWSQITSGSQQGWVEQATVEGFALPGATWSETVRKTPLTASRSNTQCESCHGPGSEHAGDTAGIRVSYDALVCGRCHAQKEDLWDVSAHADRTSAAFLDASGSASCNGCHTAQGFIVEMKAQQGVSPQPVLFAFANVNRPVIGFNDRRTQTCQTCHDPHENTPGMAGTNPDPQLRSFGEVQFRNGAVANAGRAAVCYMCHQSRTDTRNNSADMVVRRAPHDSTAAEMLSATNGIEFGGWSYQSSPHGIPSLFVAPSGENRQCLTCHNDVTPAAGMSGYGALGGHSFNMTQGTGAAIPNATLTSGTATTIGSSGKLTLSAGPGWLKTVFPGDTLTLTGTDAGSYVVTSVDTATQLTVVTPLNAPVSFTGGSPTTWGVTSVQKFNTAACVQCHPTAAGFQEIARADYDGDGSVDTIQAEITGLLGKLGTAINNQLVVLLTNAGVANPGNYSFTIASGRVVYALTANLATGPYFTFPGPQVTAGQNSQISWSGLAALPGNQQALWLALYQAAYNWSFVTNDGSLGIHNTGYAVNLLQSSYRAVTGTTIGAPFVPFP